MFCVVERCPHFRTYPTIIEFKESITWEMVLSRQAVSFQCQWQQQAQPFLCGGRGGGALIVIIEVKGHNATIIITLSCHGVLGSAHS